VRRPGLQGFCRVCGRLLLAGEQAAQDLAYRVVASAAHDAAEDAAQRAGHRLTAIDDVWQRKGALLGGQTEPRVQIFVPQVDEFSSLVRAAHQRPGCRVTAANGYDVIEADEPIEFGRKELGLKPAVWWGLFTGGLQGRIEHFDRDRVRIVPAMANATAPATASATASATAAA